jgi:hypothetical protein
MTRETKRIIEFGKDKAVVRATIRRAARSNVSAFTLLSLETWIRSQPASTRRGVARGNFVIPFYVNA